MSATEGLADMGSRSGNFLFRPRLCENSEIQIACRNSISVSLISEINCADGSCREKAIENIFLCLLGFRTFSHSLDPKRTCRVLVSQHLAEQVRALRLR